MSARSGSCRTKKKKKIQNNKKYVKCKLRRSRATNCRENNRPASETIRHVANLRHASFQGRNVWISERDRHSRQGCKGAGYHGYSAQRGRASYAMGFDGEVGPRYISGSVDTNHRPSKRHRHVLCTILFVLPQSILAETHPTWKLLSSGLANAPERI